MGDEQRRFIRVSPGTIKSCVDRLGVKASEEVFSGLAEDVSFRIRQIAEVKYCLFCWLMNILSDTLSRMRASSCISLREGASWWKTWTKP